jgi:hypothetical protein
MTDLDVTRDDLALDALAVGLLPEGDDETYGLLHALRIDLDAAPVPVAPVSDAPAVVVPLRPRRRRRSGLFVALSAAAGIVVGGVTAGAVVVADRPGELLYAAHHAILGPTDHSAHDVTELLDRASLALARGDRSGARTLLAQARVLIPAVPDEADRTALRERLALLSSLTVTPTPVPSASPDDHGGVTPSRTPEPGDDHGGTSGTSGSSGSSGSGSDDSGSSGSGTSGSSGGSGSDDSTSGSTSGTSGTSGSGSDDDGTSGGSSGTSGGSSGGSDDHSPEPTPDSGGHGSGDSGGSDH